MEWTPAPITISELRLRLLESLRGRVAAGSVTVRRLARAIGVSQPHMQNVISGKRALTIDMADRLLEFERRSVLDLATPFELGEALRVSGDSGAAVRYVPILRGALGPAHPFPELGPDAAWMSMPSDAGVSVGRPALVELGADSSLERQFPGASFALLDLTLDARTRLEPRNWYAVKWSGGGWIRRVREGQGSLVVLRQEGLRPSLQPGVIDLASARVEEYVRGLVVWLGPDPRHANPMKLSGYLLPPADAS
jgi:transcriptional regulator with XRE-family HTH domain